MELPEILVRFADLQRLAETVPIFLAHKAGVQTAPALRAEMEYALAIAGLDTELLLLEFAEAYEVDLTAFDFTGALLPDGPDLLDTLFFFPLLAYLLVSGLLKAVRAGLGWPSATGWARRSGRQRAPAFWQSAPPTPLLTIGDFVASAAVGRFVRREQVRFRLVR